MPEPKIDWNRKPVVKGSGIEGRFMNPMMPVLEHRDLQGRLIPLDVYPMLPCSTVLAVYLGRR